MSLSLLRGSGMRKPQPYLLKHPISLKLTHLLKQGPSLFERGRILGLGMDLLPILSEREGAPASAGGVEFYSLVFTFWGLGLHD